MKAICRTIVATLLLLPAFAFTQSFKITTDDEALTEAVLSERYAFIFDRVYKIAKLSRQALQSTSDRTICYQVGQMLGNKRVAAIFLKEAVEETTQSEGFKDYGFKLRTQINQLGNVAASLEKECSGDSIPTETVVNRNEKFSRIVELAENIFFGSFQSEFNQKMLNATDRLTWKSVQQNHPKMNLALVLPYAETASEVAHLGRINIDHIGEEAWVTKNHGSVGLKDCVGLGRIVSAMEMVSEQTGQMEKAVTYFGLPLVPNQQRLLNIYKSTSADLERSARKLERFCGETPGQREDVLKEIVLVLSISETIIKVFNHQDSIAKLEQIERDYSAQKRSSTASSGVDPLTEKR